MSRDPRYIKLINCAKWRHLRWAQLKNSPICQLCEKAGKTTPANEVHHIIPVESGVTIKQMERLAYDKLNLMSLCHNCHVAIHKDSRSHSKEAIKANNQRKTKRFISKFL